MVGPKVELVGTHALIRIPTPQLALQLALLLLTPNHVLTYRAGGCQIGVLLSRSLSWHYVLRLRE